MIRMVFKRFTILILLAFCSFVSYSQNGQSNVSQRQREKFIKEQAVLLLKNTLLEAKAIENFRQKTDVIIEASVALWDYDRVLAEETLLNFINQSLGDHEKLLAIENRTDGENAALENSVYALEKSLKALAGKDLEKAKILQNKFFEIRRENLKGKKTDESFDLAAEGLEFDEQRTIELLSVIIQQGIPAQFPKFIFDLRAKNPAAAKILLQRAIQNLAVNPNYKASDAIRLSVTVFNEPAILIPSLNDEANPNEFYLFTAFIGHPTGKAEADLIAGFYAGTRNFFAARLQNQAGGFFDSRQNLIRSYFLIEKLKAYNQHYRLNNSDTLNNISIPVETLLQTAGFSGQTLADVKGYALRLAGSNNPLGLDDGTNFFEKANNAKDANEKLEYMLKGIIQLIEFKKYAEAERKIFDVENSEIRAALYLLLYTRAALEAVREQNWSEFEKKTEKVTDKRIKAFLYLKALSVFKSGKENAGLLSEYAIKAEKNIQEISDKTAKAAAAVYLTDLLLSLKQTDGILLLSSVIKSVNEAPDFDEDRFKIEMTIPTRQTFYAEFIGAGSYRNLFSKLAETDWDNSQVQALQIKSAALQTKAQIAAAKAVLRKMNSSK